MELIMARPPASFTEVCIPAHPVDEVPGGPAVLTFGLPEDAFVGFRRPDGLLPAYV